MGEGTRARGSREGNVGGGSRKGAGRWGWAQEGRWVQVQGVPPTGKDRIKVMAKGMAGAGRTSRPVGWETPMFGNVEGRGRQKLGWVGVAGRW